MGAVRRALILACVACAAVCAQALPVTSIAATFHDGQTFITWSDPYTGAAGANYRYNVYRSTSPITDGTTLAAATLIQASVFNNSAQRTAQFPFSQTTRQDSAKLMSITAQGSCNSNTTVCGTPLTAFSGLAVHTATATENAYYAVITHDRTNALADSPVAAGSNATTVSVSETVGARQPLKYYDSHDVPHTGSTPITGTANLPLFWNPHGSGGCGGNIAFGDLWQFWGDSTMGYQEGVQQMFAASEGGAAAPYPVRRIALRPCDTVWTSDATQQLETDWFGYLAQPLGQSTQRAWAFTEAMTSWYLPWAIAHYSADPERIYATGGSMGAWGSVSYAVHRRPDLFAAVFPDRPDWNFHTVAGLLFIASMPAKAGIFTDNSLLMSDNVTPFHTYADSIAALAPPNCATRRPFIGWAIGRNDQFAAWADEIAALNAIKACHYGFAFAWNNGDHSTATPVLINAVLTQYANAFKLHTSYPAFTNSSLDSNPGNGTAGAGDCASGTPGATCMINSGWTWTTPTDTATTWATTISQSAGAATVDITPRNTQAFVLAAGQPVAYALSTGATGMLTADTYGLVTLPAASISGATTVTLTAYTMVSTTDTFSISEKAGVTTTNYPVQIGRPLADNELLHFPQVGLCTDATCTSVSQWLTTQADVKQRYASGYAKHAILSFYIPSLAANSTAYFALRDQPNCNCGVGLVKSDMLDPSYNFDAVMALTNGITATISAKSILTAWDGATTGQTGPVYFWTQGANATSIIIADHRNLNTCNAHACSANDVGSDANNSFRPEFHVTFWPLTHQVSVRFVGEVVNTEAMQNQTADISLSVGSTSPQTVYTQSAVTTYAATRWTEQRNNQGGQTWTVSTPSGNITPQKEIWIGGVPSQIAINHNLSYLTSTMFFPHYDLQWGMTEAYMATVWTSFAASDKSINGNGGATYGWQNRALDTGGAHPYIGPYPTWDGQWLHSFDVRTQEIALRLTDLGSGLPIHLTEGKSGKNINRSDTAGAGTGIGHILSISNRPYFLGLQISLWTYATGQGRPQDSVTGVGTVTGSPWDVHSLEHIPDRGSAAYLLTGDYWYLQEQWAMGSYAASGTNGAQITNANGRGPTGAEGGITDPDPRGIGWAVRAEDMASYITPDGMPERTYFDQLLTDFVSIEEGARCGSGDVLSWCASSPRHGSATWVWGYTYRVNVNPTGMGYPPLGQWFAGSVGFVQGFGTSALYGINFVGATGTATNTTTSTTLTLSDSGDCSSLPVNSVIFICTSAGPGFTGGFQFTVMAKSCPTITIDQPADVAGRCGSSLNWMYSPTVHLGMSQFSQDYMLYSFGRATEMGYPFANLRNLMAGYYVGLIMDSASNPRLAFTGRTPTINTSLQYFSSYANLKTGWDAGWQAVSSGYSPGGGSSNAPPQGYPSYLQAAMSFAPATPVSNATGAWNWVQANVASDPGYINDPTWALLPRSSVLPCALSATLPGGTVGVVYSGALLATNCGASSYAATGLGTGACSGLSLDSTTGAITGTPTTTGTCAIVTSYDTVGGQPFSFVIGPSPAPGVTSNSLAAGTQGVVYSQPITTTGGTAPITCAGTGQPSGLTINANCTVTGTPAVAGSFTLSVTPTDSLSVSGAAHSVTLSIASGVAPGTSRFVGTVTGTIK